MSSDTNTPTAQLPKYQLTDKVNVLIHKINKPTLKQYNTLMISELTVLSNSKCTSYTKSSFSLFILKLFNSEQSS